MEKFGGSALFFEDENMSVSSIKEHGDDLIGYNVVISRNNFGNADDDEGAGRLFSEAKVFTVIAESYGAAFKKSLIESSVAAFEMDKKDIRSIFRTFGEKECECFLILMDENTVKIKLVAGSLSKSYLVTLSEKDKEMLSDEWKNKALYKGSF